MVRALQKLYDRVYSLPFPELGKTVGDFGLYDGLLMGTAQSILDGAGLDEAEIPCLDYESEAELARLRGMSKLTLDEQAFVDYCDLLQELRHYISQELCGGRKN